MLARNATIFTFSGITPDAIDAAVARRPFIPCGASEASSRGFIPPVSGMEGLSEIAAIAKLALSAMESPTDYPAQETIAKIFSAIWSKAENIESCIYAEAESVGCACSCESALRRLDAFLASQKGA